jgi:hypothetical protein
MEALALVPLVLEKLVGAGEPLVHLALVKTAVMRLIQLRLHHLVGVVGLTEDLQLPVQTQVAPP